MQTPTQTKSPTSTSHCVQHTICHVLRDVVFAVIPQMRKETYNLALFSCTSLQPLPPLHVVEVSLHCILRLMLDILNLPSHFVLNVVLM